MSEADAIASAREVVPERDYDQTWILDSQIMEEALDIPTESRLAAVLILDASGSIIARVHGQPNRPAARGDRPCRGLNNEVKPPEGRLEWAWLGIELCAHVLVVRS